jgi:hypothetical protein
MYTNGAVRLEGLCQMKNQMISSDIEPATLRLVTVPQPTTLAHASTNTLLFTAIEFQVNSWHELGE